MTLSELKSRYERATPGPWFCDDHGALRREDGGFLADMHGFPEEDPNGPFLAALRNAFPLLCAEVEAARKVRDLTRQFLPATPGAPGSLAEAILEYDAARRATEGADHA